MNYKEQNNYLRKKHHCLPNGQIMLTKAEFVFKKVLTYSLQYDSPLLKDLELNILRKYYINGIVDYTYVGSINNTYTKFMMSWGKVKSSAICNLIIPAGTIVNIAQDDEKKMRSDKAIIHSIVRIQDRKQVYFGKSMYDNQYRYISPLILNAILPKSRDLLAANEYNSDERDNWMQSHTIYPKEPFSSSHTDCGSGIHFFLEVNDAIKY